MILLDNQTARLRLRIGQDLIDPVDGCTRHIHRVERGDAGLDRGLLHGPFSHERENLPVVGIAPFGAVEPRIRRQRIAPDEPGQPLPGCIHLRGDHQISVARREDAVDRRLGKVVSGLDGDLLAPAERVALDGIVVHGHHAVVKRDVEVLTLLRTHAPNSAAQMAATALVAVWMSAIGMRRSGGGYPGTPSCAMAPLLASAIAP